jgi:hypothetical protein
MFGLYIIISLASGLTFNSILIAVPKIVDVRLGHDVPLIAVGGRQVGAGGAAGGVSRKQKARATPGPSPKSGLPDIA